MKRFDAAVENRIDIGTTIKKRLNLDHQPKRGSFKELFVEFRLRLGMHRCARHELGVSESKQRSK